MRRTRRQVCAAREMYGCLLWVRRGWVGRAVIILVDDIGSVFPVVQWIDGRLTYPSSSFPVSRTRTTNSSAVLQELVDYSVTPALPALAEPNKAMPNATDYGATYVKVRMVPSIDQQSLSGPFQCYWYLTRLLDRHPALPTNPPI